MQDTQTQTVAEIVTFRARPGTDPQDIAAAAAGLTGFLGRTGAALGRTLARDADGTWTDYIVWSSLSAAQDAAKTIMTDPEAAPFLSLIDPDSVSLRHVPILYRMA